jgi:elongation factor Ts
MMECKSALTEANGSEEQAVEILRKRGLASARKKEGRIAAEGAVGSYIHMGGKVGVLVEVNCETDFVARTPEFKEFARNVALHVASMRPMCVSPEDIPAGALEEERQVVEKQVAEMGKPENISQQITEGRMRKWVAEQALVTQPYVKETDKTVGDLLQETIQKVGENVVIRRFVHYEL